MIELAMGAAIVLLAVAWRVSFDFGRQNERRRQARRVSRAAAIATVARIKQDAARLDEAARFGSKAASRSRRVSWRGLALDDRADATALAVSSIQHPRTENT